jgi:hypothetical protein
LDNAPDSVFEVFVGRERQTVGDQVTRRTDRRLGVGE